MFPIPAGLTPEEKAGFIKGFEAGILHAIAKIQADLGITTPEQEDELHDDRSEASRHDAEVDAAQEAAERNSTTHE